MQPTPIPYLAAYASPKSQPRNMNPQPLLATPDCRFANSVDSAVTPPTSRSLALTAPPPQKAIAHVLGVDGRQRCAALSESTREHKAANAQRPEALPYVECVVRARIPTTSGQEMWLHLYHIDVDEKEHLAIVFGPHFRSRSLDASRPGETKNERMVRGAYAGTLFPGRTSSMSQATTQNTGMSYPEKCGPPMVRIHSECYTGETVWSARCDCGEQLDEAARLMSLPIPAPGWTQGEETGKALHQNNCCAPSAGGVIIYLRQEGRGIGLSEKLKAYNLQDLGNDTVEANLILRHPGDARSYGLATAMLIDLGLGGERGIKLLTNNPDKIRAVEGPHKEVRVVERIPMIPLAWKTGGKTGVKGPEVEKYISTKIERFKHMFGS